MSPQAKDWDYIVIGAGSAGCALTHELVKSGSSVLVLEAGGSDRSPLIKIPAGVGFVLGKYDWGYRSQPDETRHGVTDRWPRGLVLGGTSSINGTIYVRGAAEDFDRWSSYCGHAGGWSAQEIIPIFQEMEGSDQHGSLRGRDGPLRIRTVRKPHAITQAFVKAACAAGHAFNEDYNDRRQLGVGYIQLTQGRGLRCSAADAFLKPHLNRRNLRLILRAMVDKIEIADGRAVAVQFRHHGESRRESARNIILCAGAVNSPKLLMLSGIGEAQELTRHGIRIVMDLPAVGRHLKDQPIVRLVYRSKIPTYNLTQGVSQKIAIAAKFLLSGEGPVSNLFEGALFLKSSSSESVPDLQSVFYAMGWVVTPDGGWKLASYPAVTVSLSKSYPVSRGRIRLASQRAEDAPLIDLPLLKEQADVNALVTGIGSLRQIMKTEPIAGLLEEEMLPGPHVHDKQTLEDYVRKTATIRYHPLGTCRMGIGADAVVDPNLRVHGIENLWIADASVMPDHLSANTNAPTIMVGMKLGKHLVGKLR